MKQNDSRTPRSSSAWFAGVAALVVCAALLYLFSGSLLGRLSSNNSEGAQSILEALSKQSETVAEKARGSVVRIEVTRSKRARNDSDLEAYFGKLQDSSQLGSGVVIDSQGHVITNLHVVRGAESMMVRRPDGTTARAQLVGTDALTDIAVLITPNLDVPAITWGDSQRIKSGAFVWSIGSPLGLDGSISQGIISSANRQSVLDSPFQDFFQTDAAINPGQSGGALVSIDAELIGLNTAIFGDAFQGIGFALPSHIAKPVVDEIIKSGSVVRGWIGIQMATITPEQAAGAGLNANEGAMIQSFSSSGLTSPAQTAGMQIGDICIEFNKTRVQGPLTLSRLIAAAKIGQTARIVVIRNGAEKIIEVQIHQRPK